MPVIDWIFSEIDHYFEHGFAVTARNLLKAVEERITQKEKKKKAEECKEEVATTKRKRQEAHCQCCHEKGAKAARGHRLPNGAFSCKPCSNSNCPYDKGHKELLDWQKQLKVSCFLCNLMMYLLLLKHLKL